MTLPAGSQIGSYEVRALLGTGGMGEVYRAHDARLKRDVAIKRLPEAFSHDADRVLRFRREAETLARVNHPNIGGIYDLLEVEGTRFLVLELVEGKTLADRLQDGPMAPAQALHIARQICEALEAAHSQGIVHRDVKPANIALSSDDRVKVLDFGLAKSIHQFSPLASGEIPVDDLSRLPTLMASVVRTDVGTLMGTAAYMSPEQARGGPVDARTDVFAFGCVLYEMLVGSRAFPGDTVSDVIAAILRSEPDFERLPRGLDWRVRSLLTRALAKTPRDRWQATGDLRYEIEQVIAHPSASFPEAGAAPRGSSRLAWGLSAALAASTLAVGLLWLTAGSNATSSTPPVLQLSFEPPDGMTFGGSFALSPDGSQIAFNAKDASGETALYVRSVHDAAYRRIGGTVGVGGNLFWSPDGRWLGYFDEQKLKKVSIDGGAPQVLADAPRPGGGTWNSDGVILFGDGDSIMMVAAAGALTPLSQTKGLGAVAPSFLSDGIHFVFTGGTSPPKAYVSSIASDQVDELPSIHSRVVPGTAGYLLFADGGRLLAQPFNLQRLRLEGQPIQIARGVAFGSGGFTRLSAAVGNGILAFDRGDNLDLARLVWFDRTGQPVGSIGRPEPIVNFRLSPDQSQIVLDVTDPATSRRDLWLVDDLATGIPRRLTADRERIALNPVWAPDGRKLLFSYVTSNSEVARGRRTVMLKDLATSREEVVADDAIALNSDWTATGTLVQYVREEDDYDIGLASMPGARNPAWFLKTSFDEGGGRVSPNGRWIAYVSNESGQLDVYVQSFPDPGFRRRISIAGGHWPRWRGDGAELFYRAPDGSIMAVPMGDPRSIAPRTPVRLFRDPNIPSIPAIGTTEPFAVSLDGQRFLLLTPPETSKNLSVIVNWPQLLNAEAGGGGR